MKITRKGLLLLSLLLLVCLAFAACTGGDTPTDTTAGDTVAIDEFGCEGTQKNAPESVTTVLQETVEEEIETEPYVYTGTAMPSDWYADIPRDPTSIDRIYIYTVEAYIAVSQAARMGDMEALSACWKSTTWNHDFEMDESFLEFMRCIFGRADSIPLVWPDDQWELVKIVIEPELDRISMMYRNSTDSGREVKVVSYFDGMNRMVHDGSLSLVRDFLREITVDGVSFSVHDSRSFEFSMHAIHEHGSDIVSFLFNDNVSDDTFATWQYCTIYEYAEK